MQSGYQSTGLMGRQNEVISPDGTITFTFYDAENNVSSVWEGTGLQSSEIDTFESYVASNPGATEWPSSGTPQVSLVTSYNYDADGDVISVTQHPENGTSTAVDDALPVRLAGPSDGRARPERRGDDLHAQQ